ncbi:MAG: YlbF family regulator [Epulopiscium sp.]|nr:YlbF family regulator [Candidatus Epulonipiscium sp.]
MANVNEAVQMLINAIYESHQYKAYTDIKAKLEQDEEVMKRLNEFRNQRFKFESQNLNHSTPSQEHFKALQDMYSSLMMDSDISSFIQAEIDLSKMVLEIYKTISEAIDFNLDFINPY